MKHLSLLPVFLALFAAALAIEVGIGEFAGSEVLETDLSRWVVEQTPPDTTRLVGGRLAVDTGASPINKGGWAVCFRSRFSGEILIEYGATTIQRGEPNDRVGKVNFFWMTTDPKYSDDLFAENTKRAAGFAKYDPLRLYYVGDGAVGNVTTRFRRCAGDVTRLLDPGKGEWLDAQSMNVPHRIVKIQLIAKEERVQCVRDGEVLFVFSVKPPSARAGVASGPWAVI